jgi:hypothetical protein
VLLIVSVCLASLTAGFIVQYLVLADTSALAKGDFLTLPSGILSSNSASKGDRVAADQGVRAAFAMAAAPTSKTILAFSERFPVAGVFASRQSETVGNNEAAAKPAASGRVRVASLTPPTADELKGVTPPLAARGGQTSLIPFENSAFPYFGANPRTNAPFLNVSDDGRRGRRSGNGRVYWHDETYNDNRVLVHVPQSFDIKKPGVIVVFFHGNGATLERDVRDRQRVPQQISESGANAVLLAPQLAVNASDSSAGKFWQPGALKRFMSESAVHLAKLYGDPRAAKTFANMPVVIVAYSGGYVPAAWGLHVGGLEGRVRGVVLLDALYGEIDKFASWIANNRSAVFVSAYTRYTRRRDDELVRILSSKGINVGHGLNKPLKPGTVAFVATRDGITHRDYVTRAWADHPLRDVLVRMVEYRR